VKLVKDHGGIRLCDMIAGSYAEGPPILIGKRFPGTFPLRVDLFCVRRSASLEHFHASSNQTESVLQQVRDRRMRQVIKLNV